MQKLFHVAAGTKGGVGKSCTAVSVADSLLALRPADSAVAIVECDSGQPDVANRFSAVAGARRGILALDGDPGNAFVKLGRWVERESGALYAVVVNAPAGGGDVLNPFSEDLAALAGELGFGLSVSWNIGPGLDDLESVRKSMDGGLLSIGAARRTIVLASFLGDPAGWRWRQSDVRAAALAAGIAEVALPFLNSETMNLVLGHGDRPLDDLISPATGLFIVDRSRIARWRAACGGFAAALLGLAPEVATHG